MAYIYKITNTKNGKVYIGKTLFTVDKRWSEHCRTYKRQDHQGRPLYSAMLKYGIDAFKVETIEQCEDDIASDRERYWIEYFRSFKYGYNATLGGDGIQYIDYDVVIETYRQTKHQKKTAKILNIDVSTVRRALRSKGIDTISSAEINRQRLGYVLNMFSLAGEYIRTFPSASEAARYVLKDSDTSAGYGAISHIVDVCKGKRISAYGFKWKFAEN